MSLSCSRKDSFKSALKSRLIKEFNYNTFENITEIAKGGFGSVYRANSTSLGKHVALKSLHENENGESFYKQFVGELTNIVAVHYHDNIINFHGISIDPSTEKYYLVLQYAKDGNLRTYLRNNFKSLNWEIKIKMAKDITSGLLCIHKENIVHKDLHSKNILVHEGRLLITDLGLSQPLDTNSNSMTEIFKLVISGKREAHINGTPKNYIKIYSSAWGFDPNQRPTIENISDSLENIKLEDIYYDSNDIQGVQLETNINIHSQDSANVFSRDSISFTSSFTTGSSIPLYTSLSTSLSTTLNSSGYDDVRIGNQIMKYNYNDFKNLKNIGKGTFGMIYSATLMNRKNEKRIVALKSIVVDTMELFVNELNTKNTIEYLDPMLPRERRKTKASDIYNIGILLWEISSGKNSYESKFWDEPNLITYVSQGNREDPIIGIPQDYINIYQDCWNQDPNHRPNIEKVVQDLKYVVLLPKKQFKLRCEGK
ncbi:5911_t:CDS:2, partial [Diversispora eburnea]